MRKATICGPVDGVTRAIVNWVDDDENYWEAVEDARAPKAHVCPDHEKHGVTSKCNEEGNEFYEGDHEVTKPLKKQGKIEPEVCAGWWEATTFEYLCGWD